MGQHAWAFIGRLPRASGSWAELGRKLGRLLIAITSPSPLPLFHPLIAVYPSLLLIHHVHCSLHIHFAF